jgi:hypothetical protein
VRAKYERQTRTCIDHFTTTATKLYYAPERKQMKRNQLPSRPSDR